MGAIDRLRHPMPMDPQPSPVPAHIELLGALLERRSTSALIEPGPDEAELELLLQAAATAPDHGRLRPWRFVVVSGDARHRFADALEDGGLAREPDLPEGRREKLRSKAFVAPTLIAVIARPRPAKVERWEQVASAAACAYAIVLAAHTLGLGAMWKSVPFRHGPLLAEVLDMEPDDELMGWVLVGTPAEPESTIGRPTADLTGIAFHLDESGPLRPH
jgi:nitroreductase